MDDASIHNYLDELLYLYQMRYQKGLASTDSANQSAIFDFVEGLLYSKNDKVRTKAAFVLMHLDPDRAQHLFLSLIVEGEGSADLRGRLLDVIGISAYPRDRVVPDVSDEILRENIDLFIKLLADDSDDVRSGAAYILGNMEDSRVIEPLVNALHDDSDQVRYAAAQSLGWLGDLRALQPLLSMLHSETRDYFGIVVAALGELGQSEAVPALAALLIRDLDSFTLTEVVNVLEQLGGRNSILALVAEPVINEAYDKCLSIVQNHIVAQSDNKSNAKARRDEAAKASEMDSKRAEAAKALGMLGGDRAVAELIKCLHDKSLAVRRYAISGLADTGSLQAEEELKKLVHSKDAVLARDARQELERLLIAHDDLSISRGAPAPHRDAGISEGRIAAYLS